MAGSHWGEQPPGGPGQRYAGSFSHGICTARRLIGRSGLFWPRHRGLCQSELLLAVAGGNKAALNGEEVAYSRHRTRQSPTRDQRKRPKCCARKLRLDIAGGKCTQHIFNIQFSNHTPTPCLEHSQGASPHSISLALPSTVGPTMTTRVLLRWDPLVTPAAVRTSNHDASPKRQ